MNFLNSRYAYSNLNLETLYIYLCDTVPSILTKKKEYSQGKISRNTPEHNFFPALYVCLFVCMREGKG